MAPRKLTKAEIVDEIHEVVDDFTRKQISHVVDSFIAQMVKGISEDKIIELRGLGTFEVKLRRSKQKVRNPKTGEEFSGKNHGVVIFRPGRELKKIAWPMRD